MSLNDGDSNVEYNRSSVGSAVQENSSYDSNQCSNLWPTKGAKGGKNDSF